MRPERDDILYTAAQECGRRQHSLLQLRVWAQVHCQQLSVTTESNRRKEMLYDGAMGCQDKIMRQGFHCKKWPSLSVVRRVGGPESADPKKLSLTHAETTLA